MTRREASGQGGLQLTNRQAKILPACALCLSPLPWRGVKAALESGRAHPPELCCARCASSPTDAPFGAMKAALKILGHIEAAGLTEHYEGVAAEAGYPPRRPVA